MMQGPANVKNKELCHMMPAAVKFVKAHRRFGITAPVCVKGRKRLRRWRATQYRVFQPTILSNNKMADALRTVGNKRTTLSQQKDNPQLVKSRFHPLPPFSPTAVFHSKFISYIPPPRMVLPPCRGGGACEFQ
jgi:hypothetical protein